MEPPQTREVEVAVGELGLPGVLSYPLAPHGLIIFAHGSGSSRFSPRNVLVAEKLVESGFATLLFDLLTDEESTDRRNVFDIPLLGERMRDVVAWSSRGTELCDLPIGLFGASTGAAAALVAASEAPKKIAAVVSRGGRPDLAAEALGRVEAPTLLIVGGYDYEVLELNREALRKLRCEARLEIVPRATHLFEEAGALEQVVDLARDWFLAHMRCSSRVGDR
jgi:putative phosphoribosyl transferase